MKPRRRSALALSVVSVVSVGFVGCVDPAADDDAPAVCAPVDDPAVVVTGDADDVLAAARRLRRVSFALRGTPPTDAEYDALAAAGSEESQQAFVDSFIDQTLDTPVFYQTVFEMGREWLNVPLIPSTADEPEYGAQQQRALQRCDDGTPHAGQWHYVRGDDGVCDDANAETLAIEAWWSPGLTETLVGHAANTRATGTGSREGNPVPIDCIDGPDGDCGCGPHAAWCHADYEFYSGFESFVHYNETGQRRELSEEPARYLAHLAFNDRPLSDLILSHTSVGTTNVQAAYVMQGIKGGRIDLLDDTSWWDPDDYVSAAVDPLHDAGDPNAWREYDVSARNPFFLAARDTKFDPRVDVGPSPGIPASGVLTSLGFLDAFPRERLRAARALENLACESLDPPQGIEFNAYIRDPAREGTCQHCHRRIDPSAIHFKRFGKAGSAFEGFGAEYLMPGVGAHWQFDTVWRTGAYPFHGEPFAQWNRWYVADTALTPVTQEQVDADPTVVFIDFLPPDQTLLGEVSDGTVGPLGFAKMIVAAGAFDRCAVRHLHQQFVGRDIDATREVGYLDALTKEFVDGGRLVRPFVKHLLTSELSKRGL